MRPLKTFSVSAVLFLACVVGGSVLAAGPIDSNANQFFKIQPKGPISVNVGESLPLQLRIKNTAPDPAFLSRVSIVVIEPFNGTRLFGPQDFWIGQTMGADEAIVRTVSLGPFDANYQDLTAGAVIFAIGGNNKANGYTGWGFVIE